MVNSEDSETTTLPKNNSNNNGRQVSFNRDVHVKRYGSLLNNDILNDSNSRSQSPNLRRELPIDLSEAALEREAALVLEQVNNHQFGSLPHRKLHQQQQQPKKPLRRSKSDASSSSSSKKSKRNSIFNFFNSNTPASSSSSTTNLISSTQANNNNNNNNINNKKSNTNEKHVVNNHNNSGKKVTRSKSDTSNMQKREKFRNKIQLGQNSLTSSDSSGDNHLTNSLKKKKAPLSPITEVNTPSEANNSTDYFNRKINNVDLTFKSCENLPQTPVNSKILSKSMESMHSSQMPAEKPPLTKNMKVDKMIKRLSMERLSPPPVSVLQAGGFSYTNPQLSPKSPIITSPNKSKSYSPPLLTILKSDHNSNNNINNNNNNHVDDDNCNNIVYTQIACNDNYNADDNKTIQNNESVHNTHKIKSRKSAASPQTNTLNTHITKQQLKDQFINLASSPSDVLKVNSTTTATATTTTTKKVSDEIDNNNITAVTTTFNDEPIIKPNIRKQIPRYSSNTNIDHINNYYLDNEFDRLHDMRETDFNNGIDTSLSSRRAILESRIKSRIGGLHINNDNHHHHTRANVHPPTTKPRYNKYGSNEIINSYSPERKQHYDFKKSSSPSKHDQNNKVMNLESNTLRKNSPIRHHNKYNDKTTDSGNETDHVMRNNYKNRRYSSRFNIGRKWNYEDDIIECELFLMKERKHTEETYPYQLVRTFVYRQRSNNDDGDYDTDQDKKNILKEWKHNKKMTKEFLKSTSTKKKKSGLEKVKDLFKSKKSNSNEENELRLRYREFSPEKIEPPQKTSAQQNIINRRRLSTPTASPIIPNRSKSLPPKVVNRNAQSNTLKRDKDKEGSTQKFNWFASLDRSRKKNRDTSDVSTIDRKSSITRSKSTSMKNIALTNGANNNSTNTNNNSKTLRFFGDTDRDEVDTVIRSPSRDSRAKSSSLQNLNSNRKASKSKSISRSRQELLNIAESSTDEANTIEKPIRSRPVSPSISSKYLPPPRPPKSSKLVSSVSSTLPRHRKKYEHDDIDPDFSYREDQESMPFYQKKNSFESDSNLSSARRLRESLSVSRENLHRDRFDSDASQRSVVYLHASVVGDIPSQTLGRRMSGKSSVKTAYQEEQPMVRTVNRTYSLSAPWKPKLISDGYEINYNNDQQKGAYNKSQQRYRSKSASRERERSSRLERNGSKKI